MNKRQNIIIGMVVILAIVAFVFGINFLRGTKIFSNEQIFYAEYVRVNGLKVTSDVTLKGFNVGKVQDIYFSDEFARTLMVSFTVDKKYCIPKNSIAKIVTTDLMGNRTLSIEIPSISDSTAVFAKSGDTIIGSVEGGLKQQVSEQVMPLKIKAESLLGSIDSVVNLLHLIFNKKSRNELSQSFSNLRNSMVNLELITRKIDNLFTSESHKLKNMIASTESVAATLKHNEDNINNIFSNLSNLIDTLAKADFAATLLRAQQTLEQVTITIEKINTGEGSFGALVHDKDLYNHLEDAAMHLERLLSDFRNNPKKYINVSLIDAGKTIYYDKDKKKLSKRQMKKNIFYRLQILYSSKPVLLDNEIFKGRTDIREMVVGKDKYKYTIGHTNNYKEISRLLKKIKVDFPDAFIIQIGPDDVIYNHSK